MRLVSAFLFVALTGSGALADEPKPADPKPEVTRHKVPFRVVKMLPETGQVLLFDRDRGSHVVAEVGQTVDGYRVDDLDDETVTLVAENGTQIILAAPPPRLTHRSKTRTPVVEDADADDDAGVASTTSAGPASAPRAATSSGEGPGMPVDPYAEPAPPTRPGEGGVRVASAAAPATALVADDPYADPGIAAFADAVGATPTPAAPTPYPARSGGTEATISPAPSTATAAPASTATSSTAGATPMTSTTPGATASATTSAGGTTTASPAWAGTTAPHAPAVTSTTSPAAATGPADDTGAALASALTGAPAPSTSSTAAPSAAPVAPPPPDLASLDLDEPAPTSTAATSPTTTSPSTTSPATTTVTSPTSPATATATSPATATATSPASATLARGELDAALADFSTLAASFRATFTPAGLRFDALRDGTLLTRIGLRKGDVITSIDGRPLRSLDDAANLYARASSLRATTIQVTRAGQPITLRVAIR